jgi:hypothetical protein
VTRRAEVPSQRCSPCTAAPAPGEDWPAVTCATPLNGAARRPGGQGRIGSVPPRAGRQRHEVKLDAWEAGAGGRARDPPPRTGQARRSPAPGGEVGAARRLGDLVERRAATRSHRPPSHRPGSTSPLAVARTTRMVQLVAQGAGDRSCPWPRAAQRGTSIRRRGSIRRASRWCRATVQLVAWGGQHAHLCHLACRSPTPGGGLQSARRPSDRTRRSPTPGGRPPPQCHPLLWGTSRRRPSRGALPAGRAWPFGTASPPRPAPAQPDGAGARASTLARGAARRRGEDQGFSPSSSCARALPLNRGRSPVIGAARRFWGSNASWRVARRVRCRSACTSSPRPRPPRRRSHVRRARVSLRRQARAAPVPHAAVTGHVSGRLLSATSLSSSAASGGPAK